MPAVTKPQPRVKVQPQQRGYQNLNLNSHEVTGQAKDIEFEEESNWCESILK